MSANTLTRRRCLPFRDPQQSLEDILEHIARIERFVAGVGQAEFRNSDEKQYAVQYALLAISEAAHRLGDEAERLCPKVPWYQIRGIGNWLRHGYDKIDPVIIWNTVQKDLVPLRLCVARALNRLDERGPKPEPSG